MRPKRIDPAPGEAAVYNKCKEYGACVVYIEGGKARSSQAHTERAQRIMEERPGDVVGTYDERLSIVDLRADINFALSGGGA